MAKYLYNNTEDDKSYVGRFAPAGDYLEIPYNLESKFANTSDLLVDIAIGDIIVSKSDEEASHIIDVNTAINFLKDNLPKEVSLQTIGVGQLPFAAKILPNGKKLYQRIHGVSASVAGAPDNIDFTIPYAACKLTGIEIVGGDWGDKVNLKVLDSDAGIITGVPNYLLNQFGFSVNIAENYYKRESNYDADLVQGLKIRLEYDAINGDLLPKTVYINFILHEMKD